MVLLSNQASHARNIVFMCEEIADGLQFVHTFDPKPGTLPIPSERRLALRKNKRAKATWEQLC